MESCKNKIKITCVNGGYLRNGYTFVLKDNNILEIVKQNDQKIQKVGIPINEKVIGLFCGDLYKA